MILSSWKPRPLARIHNLVLEYSTQFIQLIDLPPKQQQPRLKELGEMLKDGPREVPSLLSAFSVNDLIQVSHTGETALRLRRRRHGAGALPNDPRQQMARNAR